MNKLLFFLLSALVVFFQLSVFGVFFDAKLIPNVALSFVICLVLLQGIEKSLIWIMLVGFLLDIGSAWLWGTSALILVVASAIAEKINRYTEIRSLKSGQIFVLAFTLLSSSVTFDFLGVVFSKFESYWLDRNIFYNFSLFSFEYGAKSAAAIMMGVFVYYLFRKWNVAYKLSS